MIGVVVVISNTVQAQPKRMSVEEQIKILKKKLKLNNEQTAKITTILEDQREEATTSMNENRGDPEAKRAAMRELTRKTNANIKAVLTEEQAVKYDAIIKERLERMKQHKQESDEQ
jgi:periplasmic protein CpxP/Spy